VHGSEVQLALLRQKAEDNASNCKGRVSGSLRSHESQRQRAQWTNSIDWYYSEPRLFQSHRVLCYRIDWQSLVDAGLLSPELAAGMRRVKR
jgi:hypothetical protein